MKPLSEYVDVVRRERGAAIMAILNTTPDSFSDGGLYNRVGDARAQIDKLLADGADIIDIGPESTRPGAKKIEAQEQIDRAGPAIEYAIALNAYVSIDTTSVAVAKEAVRLGAQMINDVSCLTDPRLAQVAAEAQIDLIIMHSRGSMEGMLGFSQCEADEYADVSSEVATEWRSARERAKGQGLPASRIWFDPGLGFHKNAEHSCVLMRNLSQFRDLDARVVLGASRKSFIGTLDNSPPEKRLGGSLTACLLGLQAGVDLLRVHDVFEVRQALLAYRSWTTHEDLLSCTSGTKQQGSESREDRHA